MAFISSTRLRLRSILYLPQFIWYSMRSIRQAELAPGFIAGRVMRDWGNVFIERFTQKPSGISWHPHPLFEKVSDGEWMRWGYLHMDHLLRQFGI